MMEMMFYYWKKKGIRPSDFYTMGHGEKTIIRAFFEEEVAERNKMMEQMQGNPMGALMMMLM